MLTWTFLLVSMLSFATAAAYLVAGRVVLMRAAPSKATRAFSLWWFGAGAMTLVLAARDFSVALGLVSVPLLGAANEVTVTVLVLSLWGLFYYLGYIFAGDRLVFVPSIVLYAAIYVFTVYVTFLAPPAGAQLRPWDVRIVTSTPLPPVLTAAVFAILFVPILVAVLAYGSLVFRIKEREQRFRIGIVTATFFIWFGGSLLAAAVGLDQAQWWAIPSRLLGLASVLLLIYAYRPSRRGTRGPQFRDFPSHPGGQEDG